MKQVVVIICWISVIATGIFLRFDQLSKRPFHADEATGARITASRMESGDYRFDPFHYHGPTLSSLAIPLCQTRGETRWREMTKLSPRLLPATAGSLLLLVPLLGEGVSAMRRCCSPPPCSPPRRCSFTTAGCSSTKCC